MGVPKFFRYISERYPCLSEVVKEFQLPEFDNLYLDMNGIIHVCSHPNDTDPHFRITEEKIFRDIFHYIESLFRMIQPQKLFFMAVDGVAPRAKMNQQRGRRFRSAKDAEMAEEKAKLRGEELPTAERFDSNCITPGTEFMVRLQKQLHYFVTFKISNDKLWQKCKVILSGHETPGEGEHKIMDYIRYMKAQPEYDPNTRHCLYGLDADLIMLGLCTHEPHFSLLREEVKYGKKNNQKRIPTPEETTFYLLHLSLMREYLDLEFQELKKTLPFPYDLEHIIDDWVLMGFLVGNDFIPHLPDLHINKGALPILYKTYIDTLPTLEGYINESGTLRLDRFQKYLEKLGAFDLEQFKETSADLRYFEGKTGRRPGGKERHRYKKTDDEPPPPPKNKDLAALIASTEKMIEEKVEEDEDDDGSENYTDIDSDEEDEDETTFAEFCAHKNNYYKEKLEYDKVTAEVLRSQGEGYVRAIQWNLNYYYNGCCSWSWFYPHHYAPYISDIKNFSNLELKYELGKPFLPFQQLLAVLPAASKKLLPEAYHDLMVSEESPIIDFYPTEFRTDLNGKKQDWEALVLIPFIEQEKLIKAMETKEEALTTEEKSRNKHGPMYVFTYSKENLGSYQAPAYFPSLATHHAKVEEVDREKLYVDKDKLVRGLCPGVRLNVYYLGFPTLTHIPFTAQLKKAKVKVFESSSMGDNMVLTILPQGHPDVQEVANQLLGKSIFVNWPHLFEARVVGVSSKKARFLLRPEDDTVFSEEMNDALQQQWKLTKEGIETKYFGRMGIEVGTTEILIYACSLEDKKYIVTDNCIKCEKQWCRYPTAYVLQTTRTNIAVYEEEKRNLSLELLYPPGTSVFSLDSPHYGALGTVVEGGKNQRVKVNFVVENEPNFDHFKHELKRISPHYMPGNIVAQKLGISPHLLSRITGTILVLTGDIQENEKKSFKQNIALNLKFNKRNEEVVGYTKRDKNSGFWMYSSKAQEEVRQYMEKYPTVFKFLVENNSSENVNAKDLFPEDTEEKLSELGNWLKERGSCNAERQTCGAQIVEEEVVLVLEKYIDDFIKNDKQTKPFTLLIKPASLYLPKPKLGQAPDPKAAHHIFDRIVNVRESHTVPLGVKGTIIGIHESKNIQEVMYDILFDKEFTGGLRLRSSPHRGYRLHGQAFINLTFGQAQDTSRVASKPTAIVQPSGTSEDAVLDSGHYYSAFASWRNNKHNDGLGNQGSQQKSGMPAQIQTNSFLQSLEPAGKNKPHIPYNHPAPQQLSHEYLAMFNQLQKTGNNNKGHQNRESAMPAVDPSNALKKMLKIADDSNKKQFPTDNRSPLKMTNNHSFRSQLLSLHQKTGKGELPTYHFQDSKDGTIICNVTYNNHVFRGKPSISNDSAAESAASIVLQSLIPDDTSRGAPVPSTFYHPKRHPLLLNPPQRPLFLSNRMTLSTNFNWREPVKPSTPPQPPTYWCQNPQGASFQPDWRSRGGGGNQNFFPSPSQYQFNPQFSHHSQNRPSNQVYQMSSPQQQRAQPFNSSFIPLQAERQYPRQNSAPRYRPQEAPCQPAPSTVQEHASTRISAGPPSGAFNTSGRMSTRPPRSRIAANFAKPFKNSDSPSGNLQ